MNGFQKMRLLALCGFAFLFSMIVSCGGGDVSGEAPAATVGVKSSAVAHQPTNNLASPMQFTAAAIDADDAYVALDTAGNVYVIASVNGSISNRSLLAGPSGIVELVTSGNQILGLHADGTVWRWSGTKAMPVTGLEDVRSIVAFGDAALYAVDGDGAVWESLDGKPAARITGIPEVVDDIAIASGALWMRLGDGTVLVLDGSGGLIEVALQDVVAITARGENVAVLLGDGTAKYRVGASFEFSEVPTVHNALQVAISSNGELVALTSDGRVSAGPIDAELKDSGLDDVKAIAAGKTCHAALVADGTVRLWGGSCGLISDEKPTPSTMSMASDVSVNSALSRAAGHRN